MEEIYTKSVPFLPVLCLVYRVFVQDRQEILQIAQCRPSKDKARRQGIQLDPSCNAKRLKDKYECMLSFKKRSSALLLDYMIALEIFLLC